MPLCPPVLREFNRRNSLTIGSITKSTARSTTRPYTRSTAKRAAQVNQLNRQSSAVLEARVTQIKRFTRRGGPDLHDFRGI